MTRSFAVPMLLVSLLAPSVAVAASHCYAVDPPFNGEATIVRLEPVEGERFSAFTEVIFVWHGQVCNDCVGGRYPRPLQTFSVARTSDGFVGSDFALQLHDGGGGDLALTWADGRTLQAGVRPVRGFGASTYCAE